MLEGLKYAAETKAQRAALGVGSCLVLAVGLGFLTAGGWMAIRLASTVVTAHVVIGSMYLGAGLILLVWSRTHRARFRRPHPPVTGSPKPERLVAAFLQGVTAGMATRR